MKIKILKFIIIGFIFLFVLAEGTYLFCVPFFVNKFLNGNDFISNVKTGMNTVYDTAKIKTYPDFSLKFTAKNLHIKNDSDVFSTKYISARIALLPLILKRVNLFDINVEDAKIDLYRDKDGSVYLGNYKIEQQLDFKKFKLIRANGKIQNSLVYFQDKKLDKDFVFNLDKIELQKYIKDKILISETKAYLKTGEQKSGFDFHIKTKLPVLKNMDEMEAIGEINDFDMTPFSDFAREFLCSDMSNLKGKISAKFELKENLLINAVVDDFSVLMKNSPISTNGRILLNGTGNIQNENLKIETLDISGQDWAFNLSGVIENIKKKSPDLNLKIKILNSDIHSLIELTPPIENSNHAVEKLKKYGVWGIMSGDLELKGKIDGPLVYGKSKITELHILQEKPIVAPCSMDLEFTGKHVHLDTKVYADKEKKQYVTITGFSELKPFGAGEFKLISTDNVDLKTAHYMLVPIHDVVGFDLGPLPYMSINGKGKIDLLTKGTVFDGEAYGVFYFKNTNAVLKGLATRLEHLNGRLEFKGKDMYFVTDSAEIKGSPVKIQGNASLLGNIDFDINSPSIYTSELILIVNNSTLLESKKVLTSFIIASSGKSAVDIKLKGIVKKFSDLKDVSDLEFSGKANLKNNKIHLANQPEASNVTGNIEFTNESISAKLTADIFDSPFKIKAALKDNDKLSVALNSQNIKIDKLLEYGLIEYSRAGSQKNLLSTNSRMSLNASYKGSLQKLDYGKIIADGKFFSQGPKKEIYVKSGNFSLKNNTLNLKDFNAAVFNTTANLNANIRNVFNENPVFNGSLRILNFNIANFNRLRTLKILPENLQNALLAYEDYEGNADVQANCVNNKINGEIRLLNIKFVQSDYKVPISVDSGKIEIRNNRISLKSINANFDNLPIYIDATLNGIASDSTFTGYFTTKLTESFVNKYINDRLTSPIKPRGDITLTVEIAGNTEKLNLKPRIRLEKEADIYYMGANLDDINEEREINADITLKNNIISVNNLNYIRYIASQNSDINPRKILGVRGNVYLKNKKPVFKGLRIFTENNANAKLFNVLFNKSVLKNGMFNCNLVLNGNIDAPSIVGHLEMFDMNMPLYNTVLKKAVLSFTPSLVKVFVNGTSYESDFTLNTSIINKLTLPVVIDKIQISSKHLDLDNILDSLTRVTLDTGIKFDDTIDQKEKKQPDISGFVINKGELLADNLKVRGLPATELHANFKLANDLILKVENLRFNIADGSVQGLANYNFKSGKVSAEVTARHVDANKIATALFEAKDQIFGYLNGSMMFSTKGNSETERLENISGTVYFELNDGKMPKLGSVEYLLKASNLFKSGITGVSLNNFIDLIAPIKTGYFNSIKGLLLIKQGKAKNVEIFSSGDILSMYIKGTYDIQESFADLNVYGRLTKKADNILGPVGNLSFNSLLNLIPGFKLDNERKALLVKELNKIPGVEFNDMRYRIFNAKIHGDINSTKYVKSFKWIE